jgi:photosystem II stability/assembly factor-like uncharacterized protein
MRLRWSWPIAVVVLAVAGCGSSVEDVDLMGKAPASSSASPCRGPSLSLSGMAFVSAADGWVLGSPSPPYSQLSGTEVLATRDAGGSWSCQWRGSLMPDQIDAVDPDHAWVLGGEGSGCGDFLPVHHCGSVLLGTTDGVRWARFYRTGEDVEQVAFLDATVGLAAARERSCQEPDGLPPAHCPGQVLLTGDGGRQWHVALRTLDPIVAVAASRGTLWAVETRLGLASKFGHQPGVIVLVSRDSGRSWTTEAAIDLELAGLREQVRLLVGPRRALWLSVFDPDGCAMHGCGPDDLWHSGDGGETWHLLEPVDRAEGLPLECGIAGPISWALDPGGSALSVTEVPQATCERPAATLFRAGAGGRWAVAHRWPSFEPIALAWPAPSVAYALGFSGLARSTDGGRSWTQILPAPAPAAGLEAAGASMAFGVQTATDQGAVLATSDGGARWRIVGDLPTDVTGLRFVSSRIGFAVGAAWIFPNDKPSWRLYASADGGRSWKLRSTLPLRAGSQVNGLWMAGAERGLMLVSAGYIYPQMAGGVAPVALWQTFDGGRTWSRRRAVALPPLGVLGSAAFVLAGNQWDGWLAEASGLEATNNSGRAWHVIPGAPSLDGVDRVTPSFGAGWSAHNGRIWLWRSADGGLHWTPLPLPQALRGDANNMEAPVSVSFINPTVGWLLADGAVWRTRNTGQTWEAAG